MKLLVITLALIMGIAAGSIYDFKVDGLTGGTINLKDYKGKKY